MLAIVVVRTITEPSGDGACRAPVERSRFRAGPGWYPDPTARFDHRYWDGTMWTDHVSRGGQMVSDPVAEIGGTS